MQVDIDMRKENRLLKRETFDLLRLSLRAVPAALLPADAPAARPPPVGWLLPVVRNPSAFAREPLPQQPLRVSSWTPDPQLYPPAAVPRFTFFIVS